MHDKYGETSLGLKKVYQYILDEFYITRSLLAERVHTDFLELCAQVKKNVSFFGIYTMAEEVDTLDRKIKFYKKKLHIALSMFYRHHSKFVDRQKKKYKEQEEAAITVDYDKGVFYNKYRQDKPLT